MQKLVKVRLYPIPITNSFFRSISELKDVFFYPWKWNPQPLLSPIAYIFG